MIALVAISFGVLLAGSASGADGDDVPDPGIATKARQPGQSAPTAPFSGIYDVKGENFGTGLTECPHAGEPLTKQPKPKDLRDKDKVEQLANGGDDSLTNQDYSCFPQDETSITINPTDPKNAVGGANDYRLGWGSSGFYATTNNGNSWYDGIIPFPSLPSGDNLDGGGDPALVFDRAGVVYYADINFNRTDDTNGIWVSRSTNGGFTWSRPCVAIDTTPNNKTDDAGRCGGNGDPRKPGDGTISFVQDNDTAANGSVPFNDKEYIAAGPRPAGVGAVCFAPFTKTPIPAGSTGCPQSTISPDRIYVTWTLFTADASQIYVSYSDDQARSWSPPKAISGSAPFCAFGALSPTGCDDNQFSTPTVNPTTGFLYVAFENFNTPDENQYLSVRSEDGGNTFQGPFFVTPVFDVNYPRAGSPRVDCSQRGQGNGRNVLSNTCFRMNSGGNLVADKRGGAYADDLYLVMADNRNGQRVSSNSDVFLFFSPNGGTTWIGPTRVNDDPSRMPTIAEGTRDCGRVLNRPSSQCPTALAFGNDQWFPWVDISDKGDVNVVFFDRRLDTNSTAGEWPESRVFPNGRPGNYLVWNFGAQCSQSTAGVLNTAGTGLVSPVQCVAPTATVIPQPAAPINPASGSVSPGSNQTVFPYRNFNVSDTASNWDYSFRAGIFAGDYNNVAIGTDNTAWAFWTDARNGRSSRAQAGRNPLCEQSDVFDDEYSAQSAGTVRNSATQGMDLFLVTPCPAAMQDKGAQGNG